MMRISAVFVALLVAGCTVRYSLEPAAPPSIKAPLFGPVTAYIDDGTRGSGNAWPYDVEMHQALVDSGLFSTLSSRGGNNQLIVTLEVERRSSLIPPLISAFTLFLLPVPYDFNNVLKAKAIVDGRVVKEYAYENREESFKSPATDPTVKDARRAISILMSHLISDLARDRPFDPPLQPSVTGETTD